MARRGLGAAEGMDGKTGINAEAGLGDLSLEGLPELCPPCPPSLSPSGVAEGLSPVRCAQPLMPQLSRRDLD